MLFALLIVIPFGILFARYSRSYVSNMSRKHSIIQYTGFLLVFIGFFVSVAGMQITHQPHFKGDHQILGLTVFLLLFVQVFLGEVGKALMKNKRIRYVNYFHALLGTFTFGLSIWTMATGFKVWSWFPPKWAMYPIVSHSSLLQLWQRQRHSYSLTTLLSLFPYLVRMGGSPFLCLCTWLSSYS